MGSLFSHLYVVQSQLFQSMRHFLLTLDNLNILPSSISLSTATIHHHSRIAPRTEL
jgi:hypothetical protein